MGNGLIGGGAHERAPYGLLKAIFSCWLQEDR